MHISTISPKRISRIVFYASAIGCYALGMVAVSEGPVHTAAQDEREFSCIQNSDERKCRCWVFKKNCPDTRALCMADGNTSAQCDCWVNNDCPQNYDPS